MQLSVTEMQEAFDTLLRDEYNVTCYIWPDMDRVLIKLNKKAVSQADLTVDGQGKTFKEALNSALLNFPTSPLDGSKWLTKRLEPPKNGGDTIIDVQPNGE